MWDDRQTMSAAAPTSRRAQIVSAARRLLEDDGPEALSMRNVAAEIGIRAPSLYEHVADKRALESAIIAAGLHEQGVALRAALADDGDEKGALELDEAGIGARRFGGIAFERFEVAGAGLVEDPRALAAVDDELVARDRAHVREGVPERHGAST